ncbi:hypothetical protein DPMN_184425 [Dreissena polymorpha]|uniref:Uncharacterized protein n=1 Tax=Dreissena polymorpha TaxID=45954 RepID=A0A9D4DK07_DREPO|nr:hypothetical protein DPMN_184425 [Dreissena polymorpha]
MHDHSSYAGMICEKILLKDLQSLFVKWIRHGVVFTIVNSAAMLLRDCARSMGFVPRKCSRISRERLKNFSAVLKCIVEPQCRIEP